MNNSSNQPSFDLVRVTQSKREVDLSPNTIRAYGRQGLKLYRQGRATFFSVTELTQFIKAAGTQVRS